MKQKKIKLKGITQDPALLELRTVNPVFVSRYRQAYRNGADMPPITLDHNNTVVSGNHRFPALLQEYGEDHEITVNVKKFKSDRERLEYFTQENAKHGNPLDGISKKRIAMALLKTGAPVEDVAKLFDVAVKKVVAWGDNCVMVTIGGGRPSPQPLKRGPEVDPGSQMKPKQYKEHIKQDRGISPVGLVNQLVRWLKNGWIKKTDANIKALRGLAEILEKWEDEEQKVA